MSQGFPCGCVHDGYGPVVDERSGESLLGFLTGDYVNLLSNLLALIFERVLLATGSLACWMGVSGVVRSAHVRWAMGSSVLVSVLLVVSSGSMMSTLGAELGVVCMDFTLGACAGGGGR